MPDPKRKRGLGFYSYEQAKYSTPLGLTGCILIGTAMGLTGIGFLVAVLNDREIEKARFGSPEAHVWGFVYSIVFIITGMFIAHPGVIYWARRFSEYLTRRRGKKAETDDQ
jgi:multisubunit Na+/H+ antiporter MnhB subunit